MAPVTEVTRGYEVFAAPSRLKRSRAPCATSISTSCATGASAETLGTWIWSRIGSRT